LLDGHGYLPEWKSSREVKIYWEQSKELNKWMFGQINDFFHTHNLTQQNIVEFRRSLLAQPHYTNNFTKYGVSAVIIKIVGNTIHIFQHGDCFVYISKNSEISLLPRYGVEDERFTRFQVFGQYAKNVFKNLGRSEWEKLSLDRVYTKYAGGGLNISRTLGDQEFINDYEHSILFPEHALDVRTIDDPDWILITSDGFVNLLDTNHFEPFLRDGPDPPKDAASMLTFITTKNLRYGGDDASYLLIRNEQPKPHIEHVNPKQHPLPLMIVATILMI